MLPILFSIGTLNIYSLGFLTAVGAFLTSFLVWRRWREAGIKEEKIIDFLGSFGLWGVFFARLFYIVLNFGQFGFSPQRWLLLGRYPGLSFWGAIFGFGYALVVFAKKQKHDFWQLADEISFGILPLLIFLQVGCFLDGCSLGKPTNMFWGVYFPGTFLRRQPTAAFAAALLFLTWLFLLWLERRWRLWSWYKSQANGFIFLSFLFLLFLINFALAFWNDSQLYFYWLEISLSGLGSVLTLAVFYFRSGKKLRRQNDTQKNKKS